MVALVFAVAGCDTPKKKNPATPARHDMRDQSGDASFESFRGRLNKAVEMHDMQTLATMMTADFGYQLDPPGQGDGVFQYWDQNNVWPDLQLILSQRFAPKGNYMVAPPEFAAKPDQYKGYRAGIRIENGSWKFAYFVKD